MRAKFAIGAALLALASCGRGGGEANQATTPPGTQPPANIVIDAPNAHAEVRTGPGAASNLPDGVPAYPGAQPTASVDVSGAEAGGQGRIVGFSTNDAPAQVIAFYAQSLGGAGYRIANQMNMGATATLTAARAEGEAVNVTATQVGGVTQVQIIVAVGGR